MQSLYVICVIISVMLNHVSQRKTN